MPVSYNRSMYALASKLIGLPVLSLQNAETITVVTGLVLNRDNLEVVALSCAPQPRLGVHPIVLMRDIRQVPIDCLLVNSEEDIAEAEDIVRLTPLIQADFNPRGLPVITDMKRRIGKVEDFIVNLESFNLQKLYVRQPLLRSWTGASLIIDRSQIVEVTSHEIVVRESSLPVTNLDPDLSGLPYQST